MGTNSRITLPREGENDEPRRIMLDHVVCYDLSVKNEKNSGTIYYGCSITLDFVNNQKGIVAFSTINEAKDFLARLDNYFEEIP